MCDHHQLRSQQPSGQIAHVGSLSVTFTVPALTATRPVMQHVWPPPVALPAAEWSDRPRRQSICYLHCSSIDRHLPCHAACVTTTSCAPSSRVVRSPTLAVYLLPSLFQHWPPPALSCSMCDHHQLRSQQPSGQITHVGSLSVTFTVPALTATRPVMQHVWLPPVALPAAEWSDRPRRQSVCYLHCSSIDRHPPCHAACVTTTSCAPSSRVVRSPT